jgi:hypothetical protein
MNDISFSPAVSGSTRPARDVRGLHERVVFAAQQVLEQDLQRERQPGDARKLALTEPGRL